MRLDRAFYAGDALDVAPALLGKRLVVGERSVRIVEVEAYRGTDDPGSHGYRGRTPRTEVMFGPPGHLYVYLSYGMHWCANVVCGAVGECMAVLLRAGEPLAGIDAMAADRPAARRVRDLANGPGKLGAALGLDRRANGLDLVTHPTVWIDDDGVMPPADAVQTTRIGLSRGVDLAWRWYDPASGCVSIR